MRTPVKRRRIADLVGILGTEIVRGTFPVATALPTEPSLLKRFRVSRSVVREAVKTLVAKGLLEVRPRIGTRVRPRRDWNLFDAQVLDWMISDRQPDPALIEALAELREIIEPAAAALAAQRATPAQAAAIQSAFEEMEAAAGDRAKAVLADKRFHIAILSGTANPVLVSFSAALERMLDRLFAFSIVDIDGYALNLENHRRLTAAIALRDPTAARQAMNEMLAITRMIVTSALENLPDGAAAVPTTTNDVQNRRNP